jgi:hypothetical protein
MPTENEVLQQALLLPTSQRAHIARRVLESLDGDSMDADADAMWADEVESRASGYDRGEVTALDAEGALERARRTIGYDARAIGSSNDRT